MSTRWPAVLAAVVLACGGSTPSTQPPRRWPNPLTPTPAASAPADVARLRAALSALAASEPVASAAGPAMVGLLQAQLEALSAPMLARATGRELARATGPESARLAASRAVASLAASGCTTHTGAAEVDGFRAELTGEICASVEGDKVVDSLSLTTALTNATPGQPARSLSVSGRLRAEADACPTAEGRVEGSFSMVMEARFSDAGSSRAAGRTGLLDMTARVGDDARFEDGDFAFEGSLRFEVDGHAQTVQLASEAMGAKPTDVGQIIELLFANLELDADPGSLTVLLGVSDELLISAMTDALAFPAAAAVVADETAQDHWNEDGACLELVVTPDPLTMNPGETKDLEVEVRRVADGAAAEGDVEATAESGSVSPATAHAAAGAPARFAYTSPDDGSTGRVSFKVTCRAGVASLAVDATTPRRLVLDSTITLTAGETTMSGHVRAEVPLPGATGSGPMSYLSFTWTLPTCTVAAGALTAAPLVVLELTVDEAAPAATRLRINPFTTQETYVMSCPKGGGPGYTAFLGSTFAGAHQTEAVTEGGVFSFLFTGWEAGTEPGVLQRKVFDRAVPMGGGVITEHTVLELRGSATPPP